MKIADHADHTEELYGLRAEDIHKWIDGYFDRESFEDFLKTGRREGYDPYDHRRFRHCREALPDAVKEFSGKYTESQVVQVFECHLRDDYGGYIPAREDFTDGTFSEKYHESEERKDPIFNASELQRYFKGRYYSRGKTEKKSGFRFRIVLPAATALLLFVVTVFSIILPLFHDSLMKEKKLMIRDISSVAVSVVDYYISLEAEGSMSREEAQAVAKDEIRKLRYGANHDNYFWITDRVPRMVVHPWRPDLENTDLSEYRDTMNRSGKKLFVEAADLVEREGGGFLEYLWQLEEGQLEEGSEKTVSKLSFVEGIPQWGWIIGTGIYIHDVELEIDRLTRQLVVVFLIIAGLMILLVIYMVFQSRSIEQNRLQAEAGLLEAKERYRALVEASNEGYILLLDGRLVFSNPTFHRMSGFSEKDLEADGFLETLIPPEDAELAGHLKNLKNVNPHNDEFEASLQSRSGIKLDVIIRVSRIFLSEENGTVLSFRPLQRSLGNFLSVENQGGDPSTLLESIGDSTRTGPIVRILSQLPRTVRTMLNDQKPAVDIRHFLSDAHGLALSRFVGLSSQEGDSGRTPFAFMALGSSGRREMTLFSDQDNALIFESSARGEELEKERLGFLKLSDRVCGLLNQSGYPYCPGGIMAVNPRYCLTLNEWIEKFHTWTGGSGQPSFLDLHVFFDRTVAWGEEGLENTLRAEIFRMLRGNDEFFSHFARDCLGYKSSLGMMGQLRTEREDGRDVINIKDGLVPLINFARLYALKYEIPAMSTAGRLKELRDRGVLNSKTYEDMMNAFEALWGFRFSNQILAHGEMRKVNDAMSLKGMAADNRKKLQRALETINAAQSRLSYDFLGMDMR